MESRSIIDGNNSEEQQSQTESSVRPTLSQVKKSWGFRRSTIAKREFMEEVGDLTHSPPLVRRGRSRRVNRTPETITEAITTQRATPPARSVIEDLEWSAPSSPVSVESKTGLETSAAGSLDPSLWQDFGSAFHTAFSLLGGNEDLSMDMSDALAAPDIVDATNAVEALPSQAIDDTEASGVVESAEDMEFSLPVAPPLVEGGENEDIVIISSQEEDSDEMTLIQIKQQLATKGSRGDTSTRGGKGARGRAKGKGRGKAKGRGKSRGRGRGRGRAVELVSSIADVQESDDDVMLVSPSDQQQEQLQEEEKTNDLHVAAIETSAEQNNSSTQRSSTDCIMIDTVLDQITDVNPGQYNDASEEEEEPKEKNAKIVRKYSNISDTEGYDSNALYCICRQKHSKRFMICCDSCQEWFHGECVGISETQGRKLEKKGQEFICPTCNTKRQLQSESHPQPEHELDFLNCLTLSLSGEDGEGHEDRQALEETGSEEKGGEEKAPVKRLKPEDEMESNDSAALCIGPGCSKQALPDSGYCGTDCILQHAAVTMKALSDTKVPKSRGRAQKKAPTTTPIAKGQTSTRTSKRLAEKAKEGGEEEAAKEEGCTDALACDPSLTEVQASCIPSSQFCTVSEKDFKEVKAESEAVTPLRQSPEDTATDAAPSQLVSETDPLQRNSEEKAKHSENSGKSKEQSAHMDPSIPSVPAKSPPSPVEQSSSNSASQPHDTGALMVSKTTYVIPKKQAQPPSSSHISATASGQKTSPSPVLLNETRNLPVSPAPSAPSSRPSQPNNQVRQSIQRSLTSILLKRLSDCEDLEMSESEVAKLVASFEMEMFDIFRNTDSKYMNKYRTIMFNLKDPKNKGLLYRVVRGEISPFRLVRMSQKDMQATKAPEPSPKEAEAKSAPARAPTLLMKPEAVKVDLPSLPSSARPDRRPDRRPDSRPDSTVTSQEQKKSLPAAALKARTNQGRAAPDILTCMLKDTTSEHKAHLFDVKCKICTGQIQAEDEDEPAKKKIRVSKARDKLESSWRRTAGGDSPLRAPPDSPDMDSPTSSLMDPTSRLVIDSPALTIAESPASPTTDSPASPVLDSPASPVMDYPASPTQDTCNPTKPKRTYTPVVIPAVSTVTITRRDPRTGASRFSAMSVSASSHSSTAQNKTAAFAPGKQTSSASPTTPAVSLPSIKMVPKSILMKPSSSADPRLFGTSSRPVILESPGDGDTAQFLAKQEIMWKGFLNMLTVAKFVTKAYLVSGCAEYLKADLPDTIQIGGRILPQTVWDYVAKLKTSVSKELCVIRFHPATEEEEVAYVSLFSYFSSRGRFGVVANNSNSIKDVYLVPLSAKESIPSILQPLVGPGLEKNRPNLLLGLAIFQKAKRPGILSQETEEKRPSVHMSKDPMWIPKPPVLYGSDKLEIFQPYDPETPASTSPSGSPSCPVSPSDSSSSGSVPMPSLSTSTKTTPPVSNIAVAATESISSTISDTDPLTAHSDKTPLQTILKSLFGNKESDSTDSCDGSTTTNEKKIPVFSQVSQSLVDPIVQQYGQRQKSKVKEIEQEENDLDRPYDPEEEYDPEKGYGRVTSQLIKHKRDDAALTGTVDDDVAYDPEDETIFQDIQSDTIVTKHHIQTSDSSSTPLSNSHAVAPSAAFTPAQTPAPVTLIQNLPTGTVVVSAATLTEQQRMLEELNKQIEEQKRQLKEQEEALRQQREAVGMFMAHFSVSDSLMSPPQKSLPVSQLSSQTTDKTSNAAEVADKPSVDSQTLKPDDTTAILKSEDDTVTVQDETQELAKESDKYSSAGEIEDSDVAYDPEDESLFNEIQEDVFHGSSMKTCDLSLSRSGRSVSRKGASPNSHHTRKRKLSPKRRSHRERGRHRSPSRKSQRRSPSHSHRRRERDRHRRSERDKSRHRSTDQSGRQTRHRKEHSTRHHSRGHRRSSSSPTKKHSVSLSPKQHREGSPELFEQLKQSALCNAAASIVGINNSSATSVPIKNDPDGHVFKYDPFDNTEDASQCSNELFHNVKLEISEPPNKDLVSDHTDSIGSFTCSKQETLLKQKIETPVPLREIDPPIRESPESPDPEPQFVKPSDIEKRDSIKNEEKPQMHDSVQLPLVKVENNCLSIGGQAALSNVMRSTLTSLVSDVRNLDFSILALPGPGIRDQIMIEVDALTEGVNSGLKNPQMIGQEGHSHSYTGSDSQASQPSGPDMKEPGHRESLTGIGLPGHNKTSAGIQGLSPNSWGPGTHIQEPGMVSSESNIREPGFHFKTNRFVTRGSEVMIPVQNMESASMQTMDPDALDPDIAHGKQDGRGQKSVTAVTNSQLTSLDGKSRVMAAGQGQSFVGTQIETRAPDNIGRGRGQNNRGGCLHTQAMGPYTRGGGVRGPGTSFGVWPRRCNDMFSHETGDLEAHFNDPCSEVGHDQDTDMQEKNLHSSGLEWRNEKMGQDYRGPMQNIKNVDWKIPGAAGIVPNMGCQRNQNEAMDPHMNDLDWSGPESGIRDDWKGNDRSGSSSVRGRPLIHEWITHQNNRREPDTGSLGPERGSGGSEFIAPEFGKRGPEKKGPTPDNVGSGMRDQGADCKGFALKGPGTDRRGHGGLCLRGPGPEPQGQGHDIIGPPGPDFRGPCPERGGPDMSNTGIDRRRPESQAVWEPGPERRGPTAEGPRADRKGIAAPNVWGQGLEKDYLYVEGLGPGSRGCEGPAFGPVSKGRGPSMVDVGPDCGRPKGPDMTGPGPDRRVPAMGGLGKDWRDSGTPDFRGPGHQMKGPFMDNKETEKEGPGPDFLELEHENRGLIINRQGPDRRGPPDSDLIGSGCERRGPSFERRGHNRIGPQDQNSGVLGPSRRGSYIEGPGPERSSQETEGPGQQSRGRFRGPGPESGHQIIEGRNPGVRGSDIREPWLEGPGMEGLRGLNFRGPVSERELLYMEETKNNSSFSGGPQFGGSKQERRPSEGGLQPNRVISCFRPVQSERTIRGQGNGPRGRDFRSPDTVDSEPDRHQPKGSDYGEHGSERRGLFMEDSGPDWRRSNCLDFRGPGIRQNIEDTSHDRRDEWGGSDIGVSKPMQGTPDIVGPRLERTGQPLRGPRPMRRKIRGRGKDIRSLNHGDRWKSTDTVDQWSDKRGPNMETVNEPEHPADNWKRRGNMGPDEYDQDLGRQGPHGDWRGPGSRGPRPILEGSHMRFPGRDDWSRPGCQDPGPILDNPDMVYPGPSRGGPGNEWKEPDRGISEPDRRGPGPFYRGTRDPDYGEHGHDRVGGGARGLDMGNEFRGHIQEPNMKRPLSHRGGPELMNSGPNVRGFEVEGMHKIFTRGSDSRHPEAENRNLNVEGPGSVGRLGSERSGVGMESLGPRRQEFEHDFRGERRGSGLRHGSWNTNTTISDPSLDSRGLEQPMRSETDMREPGQRGQKNSNERSRPALRHHAGRFQSPSEQHSAPFDRPPAPNSGGNPFPSCDSPQNEQTVKPQRHRAALLPTPTEGLIRFPNSMMNNSDVFRQKQEQMGHSTERKWSRGRQAVRKRNLFK